MSIKANIISDAEVAKSIVMNSPLNDDVKKNLITLITRSAMATNGISAEEKIQSLTECMASLAAAIGIYMSKTDERVTNLETTFNEEHPVGKIDQLQKFEHQLHEVEEYRNMNGIVPNIRIGGKSIQDISQPAASAETHGTDITSRIFDILMKPYAWVFGIFAVCSPYAVDLFNAISAYFSK